MARERCIYCIEGIWDDKTDPQTSVLPNLNALKEQGYWPNVIHRRCTTYEVLLESFDEFWEVSGSGSVLYLATHGHEGSLEFSNKLKVCVEQLELMLYSQCQTCVVHFGSCLTMDRDHSVFHSFLENTEAVAVSGYALEVGWNDRKAPAMLADTYYLSNLGKSSGSPDLVKWKSRDLRLYRRLCKGVDEHFADCNFKHYEMPSAG